MSGKVRLAQAKPKDKLRFEVINNVLVPICVMKSYFYIGLLGHLGPLLAFGPILLYNTNLKLKISSI